MLKLARRNFIVYCKDKGAVLREKVYESRQKLYELEEFGRGMMFLRVSKSVVLNLTKIKYITPAFNGRFEAVLENGETQIISRQYVPDLERLLHLQKGAEDMSL